MTQSIQIDTLRSQLLDAYIARDTADERVKALRNLIAGVSLGQQIGRAEAEKEAAATAAEVDPIGPSDIDSEPAIDPGPGPTAEPETQSVPAPQ